MTVYYKMQQILLQNTTANLLQNATEVYYKKRQVFYYKMGQFYYKMQQLLQIVTIVLQNTTVITKWDVYYKLWEFYYKMQQFLQIATVHSTLLWLGSLYITIIKTLSWNFPLWNFLRIWSHFLPKSLMESFIFSAVEMEESRHFS